MTAQGWQPGEISRDLGGGTGFGAGGRPGAATVIEAFVTGSDGCCGAPSSMLSALDHLSAGARMTTEPVLHDTNNRRNVDAVSPPAPKAEPAIRAVAVDPRFISAGSLLIVA